MGLESGRALMGFVVVQTSLARLCSNSFSLTVITFTPCCGRQRDLFIVLGRSCLFILGAWKPIPVRGSSIYGYVAAKAACWSATASWRASFGRPSALDPLSSDALTRRTRVLLWEADSLRLKRRGGPSWTQGGTSTEAARPFHCPAFPDQVH